MQTQTCLESDVAISKNEVLNVKPLYNVLRSQYLVLKGIISLVKVDYHACVTECLAYVGRFVGVTEYYAGFVLMSEEGKRSVW